MRHQGFDETSQRLPSTLLDGKQSGTSWNYICVYSIYMKSNQASTVKDLGEVIAKLLDSNPHPTNPRLVDIARVFWKKPFLVRRVLAQGVTPGVAEIRDVFFLGAWIYRWKLVDGW